MAVGKGPSPDFDRVVLKWSGVTFGGVPVAGQLELTYNRVLPLLDPDPTFPVSIYPSRETKTITTAIIQVPDASGTLQSKTVGYAEWEVPATDDPDIEGSGGTYTLIERLTNANGVTRTFVASKDAIGGVIWLNEIVGVEPIPGEAVSAVSVSQFGALLDRVEDLEANPSDLDGPAFVEAVQDIVGVMPQITGGTAVYNDGTGKIVFTITGGSGTDDEGVRDVVGVALEGGANSQAPAVTGRYIAISVDDAGDKIRIHTTTALDTVLTGKAGLTGGFHQIAQLIPGSRLTVARNLTTNVWEYPVGTTITGRPGGRTDIYLDFKGGAEADLPAWMIDLDTMDATVA